MKAALDKIRGSHAEESAADLLRPRGIAVGPVGIRGFARELAAAFSDAQGKRQHADDNLNRILSEQDGRLLADRVEDAIAARRAATTPADRDFKGALCMLMLLKGQLRRE